MFSAILADLKIRPYQGSALPLSYGSAGASYAFKALGNQRVFEGIGKSDVPAIRAELSGTKREDAGLCGTFWAQSRSSPVPLPQSFEMAVRG